MNSSRLLLVLLCGFFVSPLFSQIELKLQLMPDGTKWGVYADPDPTINPTSNTITGSAQVTIVAPLNFTLTELTPVSGNWSNNATIHGPIENPTKSYLSVGLVTEQPPIVYSTTAPTLLFTFKKPTTGCPNELYLIDNVNDPFAQLQNSMSTNPGNDLVVFDASVGAIYYYSKNYALHAWDCHDCDNDGIANALEDTNGDGQWTPGVDVSDLCNGAGGGCIEITAAQLRCETGGTACGNQPTGPLSLAVDIAGGQAPFTVTYKSGSTLFTLNNYQSGTPFQVPATNGVLYKLVEVKGADGCVVAEEDLSGEVPVTVAGALQFTVQPSNISVCSNGEAMITTCATATNASFKFSWQYSSNNGAIWETVPMGVIFDQTNTATITSGCDTLRIGSTIGLNGYLFRAVASGNNLATAYSQTASVSLSGTPQALTHPQNVSVCEGQPAVFTATYPAGTVGFQWQISANGGTTWTDLIPNANFSGTNTASLTIQNATANMTDQRFRLKAQAGNCPATFTQAAQLTVAQSSVTSTLNYEPTVCRGSEACFEVTVTATQSSTISYQWQERQSGSANWENVMGATSELFCLGNIDGRNGNCYRVQINTDGCQPSFSTEACLTVQDKAVFVQQPQNALKCFSETASLTASASVANGYAGTVSYQWQSSTDQGQTWQDVSNDGNISGATSNTLDINNLATVANQLFRLAATTGICETTYSDAAQIFVEGPLEITQQPENQTVCFGETAVLTTDFYAVNTGTPDSEIAIRWQMSDNGTDWEFVPDDGSHENIYTLELTIPSVSANRYYRLFFQYPTCDPVYTEAVLVNTIGAVAISQQPASATICEGQSVSFTAAAVSNEDLVLQWQESTDGGATWAAIADGNGYTGTNSNTISVTNATSNRLFRLSAGAANCTPKYSDAATLTIEAPIVFAQQPVSQAVCPSEAVNFTIGTVGAALANLQWQSSLNGTDWADIAEGGNFTGTKTVSLHITSAAGLGGVQFRLVAASQYCNSISSPAVLNLLDEATCNPQPGYEDCIKLSIKLLANNQGWGVWAKADNDFSVTSYQLPTSGKVTVVAPIGFTFTDFTSIAGGKWKFGKAIMNPSQDPGKIYMEFNLTPNHNFLNLEPGGEIMLFRFKRVGACPSSLVLMDDIVPTGFFPNQFTGFGAIDNEEIPFHFCGNYAQGHWNCPGGWNMMAPEENDQAIAEGIDIEIDPSSLEVELETLVPTTLSDFFGVAPNPTRGELTVSMDEAIAGKAATLRLWNMQGQLLMTERTEGSTSHRLDLGQNVVPGTYFLSLEVEGKVLQREKIIVQ